MAGSSTLSALPANTVRLIGSTQVITSVFSVVKELLENSIDAGSTNVDVKLENYGLDKIEIRDNGSGIKPEDVEFVGRRHYTSKITSQADLESLSTYGFRGEALASLCAVSEVSLTTKTANEEVGMTYSLTNQGELKDKKPSHLGQGTTVVACHLFKNLPVRKQYHNTAKKKKEELKKIEDLLISYGVIRPDVRLSLRHNKELMWQKNILPDSKSVLLSILGRNVLNNLERRECHQTDPKVDVVMMVPKPGSDVQTMSRTTCDRSFLSVNSRPVDIREIHKLIRQYYCTCHNVDSHRHPVYYISVILPPSEIDVNVDPNKTKVMLHHLDAVKKCIESELLYLYGPLENQPSWKYADPDNNVKVIDESSEVKDKVAKYLSKQSSKDDIVDVDSLPDKDKDNNNTRKDNSKESNCNTSASRNDNSVVNKDLITIDSLNDVPDNEWDSEIDLTGDFLDKPSVHGTSAAGNPVVDSEPKKSSNKNEDVLVSELSTIEASYTVLKGTGVLSNPQEIVEVGEFNINDDVLDDSFSPTQERERVRQMSSNNPAKIDDGDSARNKTDSAVSWSRGEGLASTSGQTVQPVTLLSAASTSKRPPSPSHNASFNKTYTPPEKKRAVGQKPLLEGQTTLYDLVGSKPVKQESAFELFVKEEKQKVMDDNPDADDEDVTGILERSWNQMTGTERQKFRAIRWEISRKEAKQTDLADRALKKKISKGRSSARDELSFSTAKHTTQVTVKSTDVSFHLADLKHKYGLGIRDSQSQFLCSLKLKLIGPIKSCGSWVCCHGNKLLLANPHRLAETILYHKLLSQHVLSAQPIKNPVLLTTSNVGDEKLLKTLETIARNNWSSDTYVDVKDKRITANGFTIRCFTDSDGQFQAEMVGLASHIPMYGVPDLLEILDLIQHTSADTLKKSRPLKVINFLKSEAVRMMRQNAAERGRDDVLDLLLQLDTVLPDGCRTCLHEKPFFHQVYDFVDLPSSCEETVTESQIVQE